MRQVLLFAFAISLVKGWLALHLELRDLESYYWLYGQHPALGYFDHPPLIGWMAWLSPGGSLGLRAIPILCGALTIWFAYLAGRRLFDEATGVLAAFLVGTVPMFFGFGSYLMPDAPLYLFWVATLWALSKWNWYLVGLFVGLAMLSKYHGVFLALGIVLYCVIQDRSWFRRKEPYLAALIALVVFSPAIIWNAQHEWRSFLFQSAGRLEPSAGFSLKNLKQYPFSHLLLFTPIICGWAWFVGMRALVRPRPWQERLAASLSMPLLLFFVVVLFIRSVKDHWPAPAYASLLVLAAAGNRKLLRWSAGVLCVGCLAFAIAVPLLPPNYTGGWERLAAEIRKRSPDFVVAREYMTAAALAYQMRPLPACDFTALGEPSTHFGEWWRSEGLIGKDAIIVFHGRPDLSRVSASFDHVDAPVEISVPRSGNRPATWTLVTARGYRGTR